MKTIIKLIKSVTLENILLYVMATALIMCAFVALFFGAIGVNFRS